MKLSLFMMFVILWQVSANSYSQETKLKLDISNASVKEVFKAIKSQSRFTFIFNEEDIAQVKAVSLSVNGETVESVLSACLQGTGLSWQVIDDVVIIKPSKSISQQTDLVITGQVLDEKGQPVPGVNVIVVEYNNGTISDVEGNYELKVPDANATLSFSFIGFEKQLIKIDGRSEINVQMKTEVSKIDDVIVTGYYNQTKESFTGAATTISAEDLQAVSNTNVLAALQVYDPSFKIMENNEFGSDPNKLPEIEIRGKGSIPGLSENELRSNPNQPTIIMDGFEVSLEKLYDLDINRIASVTILKDASATAIYGSRAANGIIVVETKAPEKGKLRVNYTFDGTVSAPDLSDYNLLNAEDKLEAERLAGLYETRKSLIDIHGYNDQLYLDNLYNYNLKAVKSGVNTDWIAQPVENSFSHKHSLFIEGGDNVIKYALEANYNDESGVMKESGRKRYSIGSILSYRYKDILFRNHLNVTHVNAPETPYGSFSEYARMNPYNRMKDDNGRYIQQYYNSPTGVRQFNPLYDVENLSNFSKSKYTNFTNNFSIDWSIIEGLRLKGNVSMQLQNKNNQKFRSPESREFVNLSSNEFNLRGSYYVGDSEMFMIDGNVVLSYFKQLNKHFVNAVIGSNLKESKYSSEDYTAQGFPNDRLHYVGFGTQFEKGSTPNGSEETTRLIGAFSNLNYNYDNRFLMDASLRIDGSSKFGSKQRTAPFWSAGLGWNIHNEPFLKDSNFLNEARIRANIGETGGTNFYAYQALTTYEYFTDKHYRYQTGTYVKALGNDELKWQTTIKQNIGLDLALFNNRLMLKGNYYYDTTKDLVSQVTIAPSTGFDSYTENMGDVLNKGFEINLSTTVYKNNSKRIFVNLFGNVRHNTNQILKISDSLKAYNESVMAKQNEEAAKGGSTDYTNSANLISGSPVLQFEEGESMSAIYAVRSLGIDPVTGKEVYLDRFGNSTMIWDARDQVIIGDSQPEFEGYFGTNTNIGDFSINLTFNYRLGGQVYNNTVINKVENANLSYNVDSRVLEQRWTQEGDIKPYRSIRDKSLVRASSRFVEDENSLAMTSARVSYDLKREWIQKIGLRQTKLSVYMGDIFRVSTVERERGTSYPFARSVSFSLQTKF
ncbi:SusC/RagA family TonB-linked outer membrane protein [Carboxylicivirga sediminis]|uniref:SusC/RagA family TonB-linked outer membrane protein n=1 Tax=Carboxylicivirga sediminis TaxID=2006564 RepID=A0A941F1Z1_9BACT|nr:SusC/RagA family TonB-linked outer membrane protein [Carboxylicivirga sediminis]MBR8534280.1 SusC/RagA family TonB-linked outer membrane protein [Carboxylicivirga sediminis]